MTHSEKRTRHSANPAAPIWTTAAVLQLFPFGIPLAGQQQEPEKLQAPNVTVMVTAPRIEIPLEENPAATTVVARDALQIMPKTIGAEEAFKLVPGVKVDNQADGESVHLSIRGQGLLTERGIRGIKILLDGLPLNDPTGLVPDLFDVDWSTVESIEVFRGPASVLYGGGAAGGVMSIQTRRGEAKPIDGQAAAGFGSYGFWKYLGEVSGTAGILNYRISASGTGGDGYRDHTRYHATNLYGKLNRSISKKFRLPSIVAGTGCFNENAEGLNINWLRQDRRMANPDALTYNEYQRTRRVHLLGLQVRGHQYAPGRFQRRLHAEHAAAPGVFRPGIPPYPEGLPGPGGGKHEPRLRRRHEPDLGERIHDLPPAGRLAVEHRQVAWRDRPAAAQPFREGVHRLHRARPGRQLVLARAYAGGLFERALFPGPVTGFCAPSHFETAAASGGPTGGTEPCGPSVPLLLQACTAAC